MLRLTGAAAAIAAIGGGKVLPPDTEDMFSSIAAGDAGPLTQIQTSYATDMALGRMVTADRPVMWRLARWADDGDSDILRVNAAGILGKAASADFSRGTDQLAGEILNPDDSGARWCAGWLLAQDGSPAARQALARGLRSEPVVENVRTFGLLLNGERL